ncbi:MAG: hypothetical protein U0235_31670 [Polyangiaceae bacterium]
MHNVSLATSHAAVHFIGTAQASSTSPSALPPAPPGTTYLTTDALLTYCQVRLASLDQKIDGIFKRQQKAADDQKALSSLRAAIQSCFAGGIQPGGRAAHDLIRAYQAAIVAVGPSSETGKALMAAQSEFVHRCDKDGTLAAEMGASDYWSRDLAPDADHDHVNALGSEDVKAFDTQLKGLEDSLAHGTELDMVSLQSLMSQRQMAIQIATNLVQTMGDMANKVAANIGR